VLYALGAGGIVGAAPDDETAHHEQLQLAASDSPFANRVLPTLRTIYCCVGRVRGKRRQHIY
jgi:hypothetical protein